LLDLAHICPAVAYWLNYKNLTGLSGLFSEASLTVPMAEYLKTKQVHHLRPEVIHPSFERIKGRPRQIDFVGMDQYGHWSFAIEAKFFPSQIQQVINDICRLLVLQMPRCEKFLLIAGPGGPGHKNCLKIEMNIDHRRVNVMTRFFSHKRGELKVVKLAEQPIKIRNLFYTFLTDYKLEKMPNAFQITCVDFYRSKQFAVGIWRVGLRRGTGQIDKKTLRLEKR
jgi:hypothetical protein